MSEDGSWFAPKRFGYGAGWPVAWQGWTLLAVYGAIVVFFGHWSKTGNGAVRTIGFAVILGLTILVIEISRRRTRGGWRWRWGERD